MVLSFHGTKFIVEAAPEEMTFATSMTPTMFVASL
jgi:hypothetical protein